MRSRAQYQCLVKICQKHAEIEMERFKRNRYVLPPQLPSPVLNSEPLAGTVIALFFLSVTVSSLHSPFLAPPVPRRLLDVMIDTTFLMTGKKIFSDSGFHSFIPVTHAAWPLGTSVST